MPDRIRLLSKDVIGRIAAGEVVDRPASAVKELLENAIDAGARNIKLIVKDAGRTLIQVVDDGCGMSDSDARVCFERHATSKIHQADDLFALSTMGFRGEALASIASIAQVEMRTRQKENELGTVIVIEGSHIKSQQPCATPAGTSIAVKNLFFNVPARRNFLKRDSVELGHIEEVFRRITLAHCDVAFTFYSNDRPLYELPSDKMLARVASLFGAIYKERLYHIEEESDIVTLNGYVGKAECARRNRGEQYLFVNGRYIRHPMLGNAIEKAYADLIPERHYPSYFVMMTVDPTRIDVNIHPTKTEVRFMDEQAIYAILRSATKKALGQYSLDNRIDFNPMQELDFSSAPKGYIPTQPQVHYDPHYNPFRQERGDARSQGWEHFFDSSTPDATTGVGTPADTAGRHETYADTIAFSQPTEADSPRACLQLLRRWIVSDMPTGLLLVDQQRAHERVLYERLQEKTRQVAPQQLIFPLNCSFQPADGETFVELLPELREQGFEIAPLGRNSFVVTAVPDASCENNIQQLFDEMIANYKSAMMQPLDRQGNVMLKSLARRMAIKSGTPMSQQEMQQLLADLFHCHVPQLSPSGEVCMALLGEEELKGRLR